MRSGAFKNIGATFVEPFPYKENRKTFLRNLTISPTGTGNGVSAPASGAGYSTLVGTVFRSKGKFVQDDIINVSIF